VNEALCNSGAATVSSEEAAQLADCIAGPVLLPGDDGYVTECAVYNLNRPLEPALVIGAARPADVQPAVRFAAQRGLPVAVKTTGHQVALPAHEAVLITTERMSGVVIDADHRSARVDGGVRWQQVISMRWSSLAWRR
jgi:FAD/FMN-containing dehydrogenase